MKQTIIELTQQLLKQMKRADEAESKAHNLNLELMERDARIAELERRIEWLQTHSETDAGFVSYWH